MTIGKSISATLFVSALTIALAGCEDEGPMEKAGESVDETAEEAGDSMEEATD